MRFRSRRAVVIATSVIAVGVLAGAGIAARTVLVGVGDASLPPSKAAFLTHERDFHAKALAEAASHPKSQFVDPYANKPSTLPTPATPFGIIPGESAGIPGSQFVDRNGWQELAGSNVVSAYAGATAQDGMQGALIVRTVVWNAARGEPDAVNPNMSESEYLTPTRDGAVKVTRADGQVLTLAAADGTMFRFDVAARRFIHG
jgi:hypothetical protein